MKIILEFDSGENREYKVLPKVNEILQRGGSIFIEVKHPKFGEIFLVTTDKVEGVV